MEVHHKDPPLDGFRHGGRDCLRNVVELEVQKHSAPVLMDSGNHLGAFGGEEVQAHLEEADLSRQSLHHSLRCFPGGEVQRKDQPISGSHRVLQPPTVSRIRSSARRIVPGNCFWHGVSKSCPAQAG